MKTKTNQTAMEIFKEYDAMAAVSADTYCEARRRHPFQEFKALAAHVQFCGLMAGFWKGVAYRLEVGPELPGEAAENFYGEYGL